MLLGEKADSSLIRPGAKALLVSAWINGHAYSRKITAGRSVPRIDGEVVTLAELAEALGDKLIIHTQHAALTLGRRSRHRQMLDRLLPAPIISTYRNAYDEWRRLEIEYSRLSQQMEERERKLDIIRFQLQEIEAVSPRLGELAELEEEARKLGHIDEILRHLGTTLEVLNLGEANALDLTGMALKELQAASRLSHAIEPLARDLDQAHEALAAVSGEIERFATSLEADPERLEEVQTRLANIQLLLRKYGNSIKEVLDYAASLRQELNELENAEIRLEELSNARGQAKQSLKNAAAKLTASRKEAAATLASLVEGELHQLGMPAARFLVNVTDLAEPQAHGENEVAFLFTSSADLEPAPIEKSASGGELSRIMLALALHTGSVAPTLVFDEIDVGIGGEVATKLADRLKRLAAKHQVLVVTHLPQIAARADSHFRVTRNGEVAVLEKLEGENRVRELARMLSGSYTQTAMEHARELLDN